MESDGHDGYEKVCYRFFTGIFHEDEPIRERQDYGQRSA